MDNANVGCVQGNIADRQAQAHAQRVGMYMPDMCISTYIYIKMGMSCLPIMVSPGKQCPENVPIRRATLALVNL